MSKKHTRLSFVAVALFGCAIAIGCSSRPQLGEKRRSVQYYLEFPGIKKEQSYTRAKSWFQKNFRSSPTQIELDDHQSGHLVGKSQVPCNELRKPGDKNDYVLSFLLDIVARDNGGRLSFEKLEIKPANASHEKKFANVNSMDDLNRVRFRCLNPLQTKYVSAVKHGGAVSANRGIASQH